MQDHPADQGSALHFFTSTQVLSGYVQCPKEMRLLDLLNGGPRLGATRDRAFLEVSPAPPATGVPAPQVPRAYVSKPSVQLVAVDDPNLARGVGAQPDTKPYPFTHKSPVRVHLQLQDYCVAGDLHLAAGQSIAAVLNEDAQFIPLTDATVGREHGRGERLFTSRPLVLVNKGQIVSLRRESAAAA